MLLVWKLNVYSPPNQATNSMTIVYSSVAWHGVWALAQKKGKSISPKFLLKNQIFLFLYRQEGRQTERYFQSILNWMREKFAQRLDVGFWSSFYFEKRKSTRTHLHRYTFKIQFTFYSPSIDCIDWLFTPCVLDFFEKEEDKREWVLCCVTYEQTWI